MSKGSRNRPDFFHSIIGNYTLQNSGSHETKCDNRIDKQYIPESREEMAGTYSFNDDGSLSYSAPNHCDSKALR